MNMTSNAKAALIVACALIVTSILFGGIYETRTQENSLILWRLNRFTGSVESCTIINLDLRGFDKGANIPICSEGVYRHHSEVEKTPPK
jgi:hypothetical protein